MSGSTKSNPLSLNALTSTSAPVGLSLAAGENFTPDLGANVRIVTFNSDGTIVTVTRGDTTNTAGPPLPVGDYYLAYLVLDSLSPEPTPFDSTFESVQNSAKTNLGGGDVEFNLTLNPPPPSAPVTFNGHTVSYGNPYILWVSFTITEGSGGPTNPGPSPGPSPGTISTQSCFRMGTMIETDQGTMKIEDVVEGYNTINNKQINRLTKCLNSDGLIVKLEKGCLGENKPSQDLYMQKDHKLMLSPFEFAGLLSTGKITFSQSSTQEILYNILLDTHETMNVANITVETLNPELAVSKYFMNPTVELKEKIENDTIKIPIV